jgi:VWFA-related protein
VPSARPIPEPDPIPFLRILALGLAAFALSLPALAASSTQKLTVAQLQQLLSSPVHKQDSETAQLLSVIELTERLSSQTLARLKTESPGPQSNQQLALIADRSEFLPLPAAEIPSTPAPDTPAQRKIMALVVNYVAQTLHQMPNFLAERHTRSFADRLDPVFAYQPLRLIGQSTSTVEYRDGKEVASPAFEKSGHRKKNQISGLVSNGEFGPILSTVLLDAAHSELAWDHWESASQPDSESHVESGPGHQIAVFRYLVPAEKSHYDLTFGLASDFADRVNWLPSYHGELAVDPATGAILRITTVAELAPQDPLAMASIAVDYGPVEIAGKTYICPMRSVALAQKHVSSVAFGAIPSPAAQPTPLTTLLNEVEFTGYHVFRGEARILTGENSAPETDQPNELHPAPNSAEAQTSAVADSSTAEATSPPAPVAPPTQTVTNPVPANPQPPLAHNEPSSTPAPAGAIPPPSDSTTATPDLPQSPVYKSTTHQVILDVVVTKKDGDPITGLSQNVFALTEDGKPQHINFFEEHRPDEKLPETNPNMPALPPGAISNVGPAPHGDAVNVLLLDTLNTEGADQSYVHAQITSFLQKLQPGTQVAIFVLGSKLQFIQGFTSDTAQLIDALKRSGNPKRAEMAHNRSDTADDAQHIATLQAMQASPAAIEALKSAQQAETSQGLRDRAAMTFEALDNIAHYLEGVPGRKNLIWFAGSFPVVFFPNGSQRESIAKNPALHGYMDRARKTADLFTSSKIAVYPINAQGVMAEHVMEADGPSAGGSANTGHANSTPDSPISPYAAGTGQRAAAIYAMQQLAASTGGKAFYNTNGLNDAMKRAIDDGAHYYTLGYTPTNPQSDGNFRRIGINLSGGKYKLAYRAGYYADDRTSTSGAQATDPLRELLSYGLPNATGVLYALHVEPFPARPDESAPHLGKNAELKGPFTRYRVDFTIRASDLGFADAGTAKHAQALVAVKVYDSAGNAVNWLAEMKTVDLSPAQFADAQKSGLHARLEIDLPDLKDLQLVTAVYDWNSRRSGTLTTPLHSLTGLSGSD